MARYPATREGMYKLLGLSSALQNTKQKIYDECSILRSKVSVNDGEGICEQIHALCDESTRMAQGTVQSIEVITNKLFDLADGIARILPFDPSIVGRGDPQSMSGGLGSFMGRLFSMGATSLYKHIICDRLARLPSALTKLFGKYGSSCSLSRINMPNGAAYYSPSEDSVFLDQMADSSNSLGAGNTLFHESAHQIDRIAGRAQGDDSPYSYQRGLADAIRSDFDHAVLSFTSANNCTSAEARQWLTNEIRRAGNAANCVSDVFGGVSSGTVRGPWGHSREYFSGPYGQQKLASEAFAEITADYACGNTSHIEFTRRFMPRTMRLYHEIVGELTS